MSDLIRPSADQRPPRWPANLFWCYNCNTLCCMKDSHLTLRLPAALARLLARSARARGVPKSQLAREAVGRYLNPVADEGASGPDLTAAELARRWKALPRLGLAEADGFRRDIEAAQAALPPVPKSWE